MKSTYNRKTRAKEIFDKVVINVRTIIQNGEYEKYLKFQNKFTKYSFNNTILIFSQFPDATNVAGKAKWKELGRELINDANSSEKVAIMIYDEEGRVVMDSITIEPGETINLDMLKNDQNYIVKAKCGKGTVFLNFF